MCKQVSQDDMSVAMAQWDTQYWCESSWQGAECQCWCGHSCINQCHISVSELQVPFPWELCPQQVPFHGWQRVPGQRRRIMQEAHHQSKHK